MDTPLSPNTTGMQVEEQEMSSADALAITEALQALVPRGAPPVQSPTGLSRKSIMLPPMEAYNKEGEEEKDKEDEEEPVDVRWYGSLWIVQGLIKNEILLDPQSTSDQFRISRIIEIAIANDHAY
ncbi:hypothetical protein DFH08DRAFT_826520 [Mycena albidolilacea]|uniref:Uncharacterized protein n=1 Tax=Mycena albidolilacea TaxID=1033008 RepID=A0AAD6Z021_9AGAR|nr:hypothetical protein DFH08DRAFT_826520 [Mycena albidolilacea]